MGKDKGLIYEKLASRVLKMRRADDKLGIIDAQVGDSYMDGEVEGIRGMSAIILRLIFESENNRTEENLPKLYDFYGKIWAMVDFPEVAAESTSDDRSQIMMEVENIANAILG